MYFENRYRCRDGSWKWLAWTCPAATLGDGYLYMIARDITDMKLQQAQLVHLARYDSLTGLNNRAVFLDEVARAVAMSRRSGAVIAVLLLDLDGLKPVNDELGHNAGDAVLCEVAARLGENTRKSDMVARMGGDEFAILLQGGPMNAEVVARRILKAVARPLYKVDGSVRVTASIGIAVSDDETETPEQLIKNADTAMYDAKRAGGNHYISFEPLVYA